MSAETGTVIVTDAGFRLGDPEEQFVPLAEVGEGTEPLRIELLADGDVSAAAAHFARAAVIRIPFRNFADGRGFTLARELRRLGYRGRIRATGHVIPDQWPLARACGIDEVEIGAAQAERQPEAAWATRRRRPGYLDLLRG
jgi:uncharacterized protein (DUF934 family)